MATATSNAASTSYISILPLLCNLEFVLLCCHKHMLPISSRLQPWVTIKVREQSYHHTTLSTPSTFINSFIHLRGVHKQCTTACLNQAFQYKQKFPYCVFVGRKQMRLQKSPTQKKKSHNLRNTERERERTNSKLTALKSTPRRE